MLQQDHDVSRYQWCNNRMVMLYLHSVRPQQENGFLIQIFMISKQDHDVLTKTSLTQKQDYKLTAASWYANLDILGATTWSWCHNLDIHDATEDHDALLDIHDSTTGSWCPNLYFDEDTKVSSMITQQDYLYKKTPAIYSSVLMLRSKYEPICLMRTGVTRRIWQPIDTSFCIIHSLYLRISIWIWNATL